MIRDYVANQSKDNNKSQGNHCLGFHNLCGLNFIELLVHKSLVEDPPYDVLPSS